ncbi:MAG: hypothetical protein CMH57_04860 [Myxococcales bacterium]|nr:hypothetical protein [Myxococcales bacterium]
MAPRPNIAPTPDRRWPVLATALVTLSILAGCGFDPAEIDERRCGNNDACLVRYGLGWACIQGYCQERVCQDDVECSDGIFCNGDEVCDPTNEAAEGDGCVMGERVIDDGIACTADYCDEVFDIVRHDAAGCPCTEDQICTEMNPSPCITATCDPNTFTCVTQLAPLGDPCDDAWECTRDTVCDESGACVVNIASGSSFDDAFCSDTNDGFFCNGEEVCDPDAEGSDPVTGCAPGAAPMPDPVDDGVACTEVVCDEVNDEVVHAPTEQCECATDADCARGDCMEYACNANFTCEVVGAMAAGTACDDGFDCTGSDACDDAGACVGTRSDLFCDLNTDCNDTPTCDPTADGTDPSTGCVCATP